MLNNPDGQSKQMIYWTHPLGITFGEVVVYSYEMGSLPGQSIEVERKRRNQGLSFTSFHLGYLTLVEYDTSQKLDVKVARANSALCRFTHGGKGFWKKIIQRFPGKKAAPEFCCLVSQLLV